MQPGAGSVERFAGYDDRPLKSGRKALHHHLPFLRGQTGEIGIQKGRKSLYMPAGISGMCVWKEAQGKGYQQKADTSGRGGAC